MLRGAVVAAVSSMLLAPLTAGEEWRAPVPVASLKAFQTAFPKAPPSGAALELEALTARLGIDLAPRDERRDHPNPEAAKAYQAVAPAIRQYVEGELQEAGESVDAPGESVQKFLAEHDATLDAIVAVAAGRPRISWDTDVGAGLTDWHPAGAAETGARRWSAEEYQRPAACSQDFHGITDIVEPIETNDGGSMMTKKPSLPRMALHIGPRG